MHNVEGHSHLPSADRLSLVAATILLAYAIGRSIQLPGLDLATQLPGWYLAVQVNVQSVVAVVLAGLTAAGADWLLREHPAIRRKHTIEHWILPAMAGMAVGVPLFHMPLSPVWWAGFALGGGLILLVLIAEYITVEAEDARQAPAAAVLIAVSFALYLVFSSGLRFADLRLFLLLPAIPFLLRMEQDFAVLGIDVLDFSGSVLRKVFHLSDRVGFHMPLPESVLLWQFNLAFNLYCSLTRKNHRFRDFMASETTLGEAELAVERSVFQLDQETAAGI